MMAPNVSQNLRRKDLLAVQGNERTQHSSRH